MKLRVGIVGCGKFADVHVQQVHTDADPRISAFDRRHRPASGDAVTDAVMELRFLMQGERVSSYGLPHDTGQESVAIWHWIFYPA